VWELSCGYFDSFDIAKGAFVWKKSQTLILKVIIIVWYVTNAIRPTWDEQHNGTRSYNFSNIYVGLLFKQENLQLHTNGSWAPDLIYVQVHDIGLMQNQKKIIKVKIIVRYVGRPIGSLLFTYNLTCLNYCRSYCVTNVAYAQ